MSDIFDHEVDAYESYDRRFDEPPCYGNRDRVYSNSGRVYGTPNSDFKANPLFYHVKLAILGIAHETERAYLLKISDTVGLWVPKSTCRKLKKRSVYVHKTFADPKNYVALNTKTQEKEPCTSMKPLSAESPQ